MIVTNAGAHPRPPRHRMMVFVDGENLVSRFEDTRKAGKTGRSDLQYEPGVFIWHPSYTQLAHQHEVVRATLYSSARGDSASLDALRDRICDMEFSHHPESRLPRTLSPWLFKREANRRAAKGVDIQIAIDIITNAAANNCDAILLLSGDGDFVPVLQEAVRLGKQVFVSAYASGLNPALRRIANQTYLLDGTTWVEPAP